MSQRFGTLLVLVGITLGCERSATHDLEGVAPPPVASATPGLCASGGGTLDDPISTGYFARSVDGYCIDPNGQVLTYGKSAKGTLDEVCTQQFDGECEVYKSFGLERVLTLRYVDGAGTPGAVAVTLSEFSSVEGAYGFYSKRVVAGADPAETRLKPLKAEGHAALGGGVAYVWRGTHVAELSYSNPQQPPDELRASATRILPTIVSKLKLPGSAEPPAAVRSLPVEDRIPLGIEYIQTDIWGISGAGAAAMGYYAKDGKRWRMVVVQRQDADSAEDVAKTLRKAPGYSKIKDAPKGVFRLTTRASEESPSVTWLVARGGATLVAIGDDEFALADKSSAEQKAMVSLDYPAKLALLQAVLKSPVTGGE